MSTSIETTRTANRLNISIPTDELNEDQIQDLVTMIRVESILSKSKLTQADADEIARDINRSWWEKNRHRIEKLIAEHE